MREMPQRRFLVWQQWMKRQWDKPDRTDHYLMRIAAETRRSYVEKPNGVDDNNFKISFKFEEVQKEQDELGRLKVRFGRLLDFMPMTKSDLNLEESFQNLKIKSWREEFE